METEKMLAAAVLVTIKFIVAAKRTVQLTLSEPQLRLLVESMYIANWVICAGEQCADLAYRTSFEKLEQEIYRKASEHGGCADLLEHEPGDHRYYPTRLLEENSKAREALDAHSEENFWEELIDRLSTVFAMRDVGPTRWEKMSQAARFKLSCAQEDRIREVFRTHGLHAISLISADPAQ